MKLTEQQYELIEAYLNDELSAIDRAAFDVDLDQNADLRAEMQIQRELRLGLQAFAIEQKLKQAHERWQANKGIQQHPEKGQQPPLGQPPLGQQTVIRWLGGVNYWWAAASVVIIIGVSLFFYRQNKLILSNELAYNEVYRPDLSTDLTKEFPVTMRPDERARLLELIKGYKAGMYDTVITKLQRLPEDRQTVHYKNYFLGLSYLANKQPTKAIPYLTVARKTPSLSLRQKSEWFLALAYLNANNKAKALPILLRISSNRNHPFNAFANQVLTRLRAA